MNGSMTVNPAASNYPMPSQPISRILFPQAGGDHPSGQAITGLLEQSTRVHFGASHSAEDHDHYGQWFSFTLLDLAPGGVCRSRNITAPAGGLLHHRFTLTGLNLVYYYLMFGPTNGYIRFVANR